MRILVVESEANECAQGLFWRLMLQVQGGFDASDLAVCLLENGNVQTFLAAEIIVDHALAGLGAGRNIVDARTAEAHTGKLLGRNFNYVALGSVGIVDALATRFRAVKGVMLHFSARL